MKDNVTYLQNEIIWEHPNGLKMIFRPHNSEFYNYSQFKNNQFIFSGLFSYKWNEVKQNNLPLHLQAVDPMPSIIAKLKEMTV